MIIISMLDISKGAVWYYLWKLVVGNLYANWMALIFQAEKSIFFTVIQLKKREIVYLLYN